MQRGLRDVVLNALDLCELYIKSFETWTYCASWRICLWRNSFQRADVHRKFAEPDRHLVWELWSLHI